MFSLFALVGRGARLAFLVAGLWAIADAGWADFTVFSDGGDATPISIQGTVDAFRAALGEPNNGNAPGPLSGRREINWDGGGSMVSSPAGVPFNGFQNTRGASFSTPGTGFLQTPVNDAALTSIQPSYATEFGAFSPVRVFTPLGSNLTDATFSIPGSGGSKAATISGFGAIFSDVDVANSTTLEFFDAGDNSLLTIPAPTSTQSAAGFSFVGAVANSGERIARVRITTGNSALGPADGGPLAGTDVVVMDDFFYSEPLPEPTSAVLGLLALCSLVLVRPKRK